MGWAEKVFEREATFDCEPDEVRKATGVMADHSLASWQILDSATGLEGRGNLGGHDAFVSFAIEGTASGTRVKATLRVQRASALGYMIVDIGGYYDGHLRNWMDEIGLSMRNGAASNASPSRDETKTPPGLPSGKPNKAAIGCLMVPIVIFFVSIAIYAINGVITGQLYLSGRDGREYLLLDGAAGRIVSSLILGGIMLLIWRFFKAWKYGWKARQNRPRK